METLTNEQIKIITGENGAKDSYKMLSNKIINLMEEVRNLELSQLMWGDNEDRQQEIKKTFK